MPNKYQNGEAIAPSRGRPSKKIPTPYSRPSIDLGGGSSVKKDWQWISAFDLKEGDVIAGHGVVLEIKTQVQYGADWQMFLRTPRHEHGTIVEATDKFYTFCAIKKD